MIRAMAKEFVGDSAPFTWRKWRLEIDREHDCSPHAWRYEDDDAYVVVSLEAHGSYEALVDIAYCEGTGKGETAREALDAALLMIAEKAAETTKAVIDALAYPKRGNS